MRVSPYIHRCTVREGDLAGNKTSHIVQAVEVELGTLCPHCDEPLATVEQITLHLYEQLADDLF